MAILQHHSIDVLVTDVKLPGASGIELVRMARARNSSLCVVFATGDTSEIDVNGEVVVSKPYSPSAIVNAIARARSS